MSISFDSQPHPAPVDHDASHERIVRGQPPEGSVAAQVGARRAVYRAAVDAIQGFTLFPCPDCHGGIAFLLVSRVRPLNP